MKFHILLALMCVFAVQNMPGAEITAPTFVELKKECPTGAVENCSLAFFKKMTEGLCVDAIEPVDPVYWQASRKMQLMPNYQAPLHPPSQIWISDIRFMQDSASGLFNDNQHDIIELANQIKADSAILDKIPKIEVWQDDQGRIWTTNHRRLIGLILSGRISKIPVTFVDEATVIKNKYEFTTTTEGKILNVWLTDQLKLVISNKNRCAEEKDCSSQK